MWLQKCLKTWLLLYFGLLFYWPAWLLLHLSIWKPTITSLIFDLMLTLCQILFWTFWTIVLLSYLRLILVTNLKYRSKFYPYLRGMKHLATLPSLQLLPAWILEKNICIHPLPPSPRPRKWERDRDMSMGKLKVKQKTAAGKEKGANKYLDNRLLSTEISKLLLNE